MNLIAAFLTEAAQRPEQTAIIDGQGRQATFASIVTRSATLAGAWRAAGIRPGDRLLLAMGVGIDLYVALAAAWRLGAAVVFPEPALGLAGLRHAARVATPKAYLSSGWYRALRWIVPELRSVEQLLTPHDCGVGSAHVEDVAANHPALISFTSGSTGAPKAIVRSHEFLAAQNACVSEFLRPRTDGEIDLVAFPVFVIANLGLGVTSVLPNWNLKHHDAVTPDAIAAHMRHHGVTRALLPPSVCESLAQAGNAPRLNAIFTGGGPVFPDLMQRLAARFPGADIAAVYGSTEAEPIAHVHVHSITAADWQAMTSGSGLLAGKPIAEISLRLRDDEILVSGRHVNTGYLDSADDTSNKVRIDGRIWHRTGDAGRLDAQGRLWLLGRHEARAGTLYPFAVEVAARSWPGVRNAALIATSGKPILAIEGDAGYIASWQSRAVEIANLDVIHIAKMPLDRRHRSKIDYRALRQMVVTG